MTTSREINDTDASIFRSAEAETKFESLDYGSNPLGTEAEIPHRLHSFWHRSVFFAIEIPIIMATTPVMTTSYGNFRRHPQIAFGSLNDVAAAIRAFLEKGNSTPIPIFDELSRRQIVLDPSESIEDVALRYEGKPHEAVAASGSMTV